MNAELNTLEKKLNIKFKNKELLQRAMLHSSFINENKGTDVESNERLEFLGDAVLSLVVAEYLYSDCDRLAEGEMTRLRAQMVMEDSLLRLAEEIGIGNYLILGKGEEKNGGRSKKRNLVCALEALIAAIYLDRGLSTAQKFILKYIQSELQRFQAGEIPHDFKSKLQEFTQSHYKVMPNYQIVAQSGPDHSRIFSAEVRMGETVLGAGSGRSKQSAEEEAAKNALRGCLLKGLKGAEPLI